MMALLSLICLLIFIFVWFGPVLKRHKQIGGYIDKKTEAMALFMGMIPTLAVIFLSQLGIGWIFHQSGMDKNRILLSFLQGFIMYGLIEEITKYGFARLVLKKFEKLKKIDIMVIFGFVGMGYEITESMLYGNLIAGIGRGLFVAHIMYQLIMAHFFYESIHAKNTGDDAGAKRNRILTLAIPVFVHGLNDLFCELSSMYMDSYSNIGLSNISFEQAIPIIVYISGIIITNVACLVWGLRLSKKDPDIEVSLR